jgi:hypothetical protein
MVDSGTGNMHVLMCLFGLGSCTKIACVCFDLRIFLRVCLLCVGVHYYGWG